MRLCSLLATGLVLLTLNSCMSLKPIKDWKAVYEAAEPAAEMPFAQSWEKEPAAPDGSYVKVVREADALLVYARMHDTEIFNSNTTLNAPFFLEGDVFEVFLRPEGQEAYVELHIGPQNQQMQLKIDSSEKFYEVRKTYPPVEALIGPYKMTDQHFASGVRMLPDDAWEVAARIPYAFLSDGKNRVGASSVFHANFCRYDYARGVKEPTYWATAPLSKLDFHHQPDWQRLEP